MKNVKHIGLALFLFIALLQVGFLPQVWAGEVNMVILHTNDFHGSLQPMKDKKMVENPDDKVGGSAYLGAKIETIKADNPGKTLLLDGGDFAQGTPVSNTFYGKPVIEIMNYLKYDAMTVGNHEFDWGVARMSETLKDATFPILCANIKDKKTNAYLPFAKPYVIKEVAGLKVGIIGVIWPKAYTIIKAANTDGYEFLSAVDTLKSLVPELKSKGAQFIIVLSHNGLDDDKLIAEQAPGINVIVGAHSHSTVKDTVKVKDTLIVQASSKGKYLGRLDLTLDSDSGKILKATEKDELLPIIDKNIAPDKNIEAIVASYLEKVKPLMDREVGETTIELSSETDDKTADTVLGNLITDAMRAKTCADIAVYNRGGIRAPISKGIIRWVDVFNVLPFDDYLVSMDLTGAQVQQLVEQSATLNKAMLQFSGVHIIYSLSAEPGKRVKEIWVGGTKLDPNKVYRLTTTEFLASGGDDFSVFKEGKNLQTDVFARDAFAEYLQKHKPITSVETGRIVAQP